MSITITIGHGWFLPYASITGCVFHFRVACFEVITTRWNVIEMMEKYVKLTLEIQKAEKLIDEINQSRKNV